MQNTILHINNYIYTLHNDIQYVSELIYVTNMDFPQKQHQEFLLPKPSKLELGDFHLGTT